MGIRHWIKLIAGGVVAAAAQFACLPVAADPAAGSAAPLGHAMNPGGVDTTRERDPAGLGPYRMPASRTPSGQLYDIPVVPPSAQRTEAGWDLSGFVEGGLLAGEAGNRNARFREYRDIDNGIYLNAVGMQAAKPDEARFAEFVGGGLGRDDQYVGAQFGRYNDYRINLAYSEIPHVFASSARPIWQGVGSGNLTLTPWPGVAAGGASGSNNTNAAALQGLVNATGDTQLGLLRKKGSARVDLNLSDRWKFYSSYALEHRIGARPFGANEGNGETIEPIDYKTHDLRAGLQYVDELTSFNLALSASLFRNDIDALTWENPFRHTNGALQIRGGRLDLTPDNDAYNARMEYARTLPDFYNGRFNATVALGSMRQDDKLLPPTITSGTGAAIAGGFNGNFNLWNTTAALSQPNANARIDTRLVDLGLALTPAGKFTLRANLRHYETRNHTNYTAFNPQTGQFGYIIQDTNASTVYSGTNNVHYRSIPFQGAQDNAKLSGEFQLRRRTLLNLEYEREDIRRDHRERDKTWEDRVRLAYTDRGFDSATLRLAYEYGSRRGSPYRSDPYKDFYTASLASYTDTIGNVLNRLRGLEELRKYDLADRRQHVLKLRVNYMPRADIDLGTTLQAKLNRYPADFGRTGTQTQNTLNFDLGYTPTPGTALTAYYSRQAAKMKQAAASDLGNAFAAGCAVLPPSCSNSFGAAASIYPADRYWSVESRDRSDVFGLGLRHDLGKASLDVQYRFSASRSPLGYSYASANALQTPALVADAGNAFPDLTTRTHAIDASMRVPLTTRTAVRFLYHGEIARIADWHYSGLEQASVVSNRLYLDAGPQSFRVHFLGAFLQLSL